MQILLTPADFNSAQRRKYWNESMEHLISEGIIPVINTNDAVDWKDEASEEQVKLQTLIYSQFENFITHNLLPEYRLIPVINLTQAK